MAFTSSLLRTAIKSTLRPTVKAVAGVDVVYHSAVSGNTYAVRATLADPATDTNLEENLSFSGTELDFKIDVADLPVVPQYRDSIEWEQYEGVTKWWQVLELNGSREFEQNDNFGIAWRIHTKYTPTPEMAIQAYGDSAGQAYGTLDDDAYGGPT